MPSKKLFYTLKEVKNNDRVFFNILCMLKIQLRGQARGFISKGACYQAWQPEFGFWNSSGGRRELTPASICKYTCKNK